MRRKCSCSGACIPQSDHVDRREFISIVGAGTTTAILTGPAWAAWLQKQMPPEELSRWKRSLFEPAAPRVYRSGVHKDARLHLGGIGTGNIELGADGQFTNWQLFNTLCDGQVPLYFAVKAGNRVRLLQTEGGPGWPLVRQIEMTGEYPVARLRCFDSELPVRIELTAFTPFAPLDAKFSSMPLAALVFRIHNATDQAQSVSLAGFLQNPVGYDAAGRIEGVVHPNFGANVNEALREGPATGLFLRAEPGAEPTLDRPVFISTQANLKQILAPPRQWPSNLTVEVLDRQAQAAGKLKDPAHTVIWFEDGPMDMAEEMLRSARDAVRAGATLVFSGQAMPLLQSLAQATGGKPLAKGVLRPDILFEDFEHGYDKWTVEGDAFGPKPPSGTLPGQQKVSGFLGSGLANTFRRGDGTTGRLVSKPFTVERSFIRFLVGGGNHPDTQIRLIVDGKIVRAASGRNNEQLLPALWNVREFQGKEAHLEIVDENRGGWGHINVDHIEFSDQVANRAVMELLDELLPARFSNIRPLPVQQPGDPRQVAFDDLHVQPGVTLVKLGDKLQGYSRQVGKGQVVLVPGAILELGHAQLAGARHRAFAMLARLVGAQYVAPSSVSAKAPGFGTLALAAVAPKVTVLPAADDWKTLWETFAAQGRFTAPDQAKPNAPTPPGHTVNGGVAVQVEVPPDGSVEVPFLLAWHYPNKYNPAGTWMGCHYATQWPDARAVVREAAANLAQLRQRTESFRKSMYDSTLPYWLLDCLTSQAATIRHIGVVFRIANGDIFGWEGSNGCCQPTCTHVWGYEQSLSRLFPDLERAMRRIDFKHQQRPDGGVNNRTEVPSPPHPTGERPFVDGHASCILKAYREALNHSDEAWFKQYWPHIKKAVQYLIDRDAKTKGGQPAGYLEDDQWNTYDEALHGVTTFMSGYYLAALRAGEEWARRAGDEATARRFHAVFQKGQQNLIKKCWNGEYFQQDLADYEKRPGEVGPGCMADQLIGQWWAHQLGLGYILPKELVQTALRSVFKYNWVPDLTGFKHMPRAFAGDKDKGLLICTWPKGGRPGHVMLYSDEVWTGIEYQVAAHMIYEGMLEEGLAIVKGARDRYDGIPRAPILRNPWNEIECGGHYARAMSSWSLLLALSGYECDALTRTLRFTPRITPNQFKSLFCGPDGWGTLAQVQDGQTQRNEIAVVEGQLTVSQLQLVAPAAKRVHVTVGEKSVEATLKPGPDGTVLVAFASPVTVKNGQRLATLLT